MYWPKFSRGALERKIANGQTPSGVSCSYIQWTKKVGLKLFSSKRQRDHSFRGQFVAAGSRLAPRVGEKVEVNLLTACTYGAPQPEFHTFFGFFTESAKVNPRGGQRASVGISDQLEELGILHTDLHNDNVGKIGKRFVAIDFDSCSCRFTDKVRKIERKLKKEKRRK